MEHSVRWTYPKFLKFNMWHTPCCKHIGLYWDAMAVKKVLPIFGGKLSRAHPNIRFQGAGLRFERSRKRAPGWFHLHDWLFLKWRRLKNWKILNAGRLKITNQ